MIVSGFEWDAGNTEKCQKHGLSIDEIERFFLSGNYQVIPDIRHSSEEKRMIIIGKGCTGRWTFVGFTVRGGLIRPVTARYMHHKEVQYYEEDRKKTDT